MTRSLAETPRFVSSGIIGCKPRLQPADKIIVDGATDARYHVGAGPPATAIAGGFVVHRAD